MGYKKISRATLDFAKTYDTLQRFFLLAVLTWMGVSKTFVNIVAALHKNTACKFIVNVSLFRRVRMNCGIRKGCPIAPSKFIFALDSAYKAFRMCEDIHVIKFHAAGQVETVALSAYADDLPSSSKGGSLRFLLSLKRSSTFLDLLLTRVSPLLLCVGEMIPCCRAHAQPNLTAAHRHMPIVAIQIDQIDETIIKWDICFQSV